MCYIFYILTVGAKFRRASCDCESDKFAEGLFCEKDVPPCLVVQCDPLVTCHNVSTNKINPCGKCPEGYSGNGMSCMGKILSQVGKIILKIVTPMPVVGFS